MTLPDFILFNNFLPVGKWSEVNEYCLKHGQDFEFIGYGSPIRYKEHTHSKYADIKYKRSFLIDHQEWELLQKGLVNEPFPEDTKHGDNYNVYMVDLTNRSHKLFNSNVYFILHNLLLDIQQIINNVYSKTTIFESGPWLTRVPTGGNMNLHCDGTFIADPTKTTDFSAVYYVNEDFEGGELEMPAIGLSLKPRQNSLVIWANVSNEDMVHGVRPVTDGNRYMSQGFFASV